MTSITIPIAKITDALDLLITYEIIDDHLSDKVLSSWMERVGLTREAFRDEVVTISNEI